MIKTFYAIVTERDCSDSFVLAHEMPIRPQGPLLFESYLNKEAQSEEIVAQLARKRSDYGWVRLARVTVDIPEYCCEKGRQQELIDKACPDCIANFGEIPA